MRRWLTLSMACACAPPVVGDSPDPSSTTDPSATTAMLDDRGTSDPPDSTTTAGTSTGAAEETSLDEFPGEDGVSLDQGAEPKIELCESSAAQQIDLVLAGPDGAVATAYGWWGWETCCVNDPWLVLTEAPQIEVTMGQVLTPHFAVYIQGDWDQRGAYLGPLPIWFDVAGGDLVHETGFELLEPLDPELATDDEQPLFSGAFAIDEAGWSAQGSVVVPHCDALDTLPCPCE